MIERRIHNVTLRAAGDGKPRLEGYGAVFNSLSENLGGFREKIEPGAFLDVLANDVRALWQHDPGFVFGRTASGTLHLREDSTGLWYEADPPDAQWARDAMASISRGDVSQSSFGFNVDQERWEEDEDGRLVRTILKVKRLYDVSPVTYPAYLDTSVEARSVLDAARARNLLPAPATSGGDQATAAATRSRVWVHRDLELTHLEA